MPPNGLTVLAPLRPGEEQPLRDILRAIGNDVRGKALQIPIERPHIHFSRSRHIHFARFAIVDDPDRGPERKRLLFSSNYDGDLDSHLAELIAITTDMSAIWGRCEAYRGVDTFAAFIRAHAHEPDAFYIAFREETVQSIHHCIAVRRGLHSLLDCPSAATLATAIAEPSTEPAWIRAAPRMAEAAARQIVHVVRRLARGAPILADGAKAVSRSGLANVFQGAKRITASLGRYPIFRLFNWITRNRLPPPKSPYSSAAIDSCASWAPLGLGDEIPSHFDQGTPPTFREDVVVQNQLTLITVVDPRYVKRVTAVMSAIDSYAKRLAPPGSLIGIGTIHFVRWLLIDDGRRLMMLSDYDGSWESYIDEFAEMILSGLDAIWETSFGYPADGARDLPAFKYFLRAHQVPSEVFFSAYPDETILNIVNDRILADALADAAATRVKDLLQRT